MINMLRNAMTVVHMFNKVSMNEQANKILARTNYVQK